MVPVDLSKTARFGVRSECSAFQATFDCQRDERQEEERVSVDRRCVAARTSKPFRTALAESAVDSTSVTNVTDLCDLNQTTLNRLQIGHTRATHAHLLGDDEACCATCYTSLTVNHILIECPQFNHLRQQYHFGSTCTLKELFNNTSVNDIIAFIKNIHFYTRI